MEEGKREGKERAGQQEAVQGERRVQKYNENSLYKRPLARFSKECLKFFVYVSIIFLGENWGKISTF